MGENGNNKKNGIIPGMIVNADDIEEFEFEFGIRCFWVYPRRASTPG